MGFYKQFETFDPLEERVLVSGLGFYLPDITRRARTLLCGRTKAEIISIAEMADWFIDQFLKDQPELINAGINGTDFFALSTIIDAFDLEEDDDFFPTRKREEYFAVLALWKVADAISARTVDWVASLRAELANHDSPEPPEMLASLDAIIRDSSKEKRMIDQHATDAAASVEAMQAICWAEYLEVTGKHEAEIARLRIQLNTTHEATETAGRAAKERADRQANEQRRNAAYASHAKHHAAKAAAFAWCRENLGDKTAEDAAKEIIKIAAVTEDTAKRYVYQYRKQSGYDYQRRK